MAILRFFGITLFVIYYYLLFDLHILECSIMTDEDYSAVNAKGQVVIPVELRNRFGIRQGTKVAFIEEAGRLIMQPVTDAFIKRMRGSLAKRGMPSELERDQDRELE
jgi:antitoxin PrlF